MREILGKAKTIRELLSGAKYAEFKKADLVARQALYLDLAKRVWSPTLIQAVREENA